MEKVPDASEMIYDNVDEYSFQISENKCYGEVSSKLNSTKIMREGTEKKKKALACNKVSYFVVPGTVIIMLLILSCAIAFALEISKLKSETAAITSSLDTFLKQKSSEIVTQYNSSIDMLHQLLSQDRLENDVRFQQQNNSIDFLLQQQIQHVNTTQQLNSTLQILLEFGESCASLPPSSLSGYYLVRASNGSAVRVYCDMTRSCGGVTGGWMRVANLDMTDSNQQCPSGLRQRNDSNIRTCSPSFNNCSSVTFSTGTFEYSKVCGKINGYQVGAPDTYNTGVSNPTIDSNYVDGVILTHGQPRQHIWTFAAGLDEINSQPFNNCPCNSGTATPPSFVTNEYFCDTGSKQRFILGHFYSEYPLWDGTGCGPSSTCCSLNNPPWFYKQLPQSTTDDIEMRVCRSCGINNEDVSIETVQIYIQ